MISALKKNWADLENKRLETIVAINHIKENDFGGYMSIKFAYWAIIISTLSTIYQGNVFEIIGLNKFEAVFFVTVMFLAFLLILGGVIHRQHHQLEYLNFKLHCIDTMMEERRKQNEEHRKNKKNNRNGHL